MSSFAPPAQFHTPVLMVIFNRPETTKIVFDAIRSVRPSRLYIAADGPRPHVASDAAKCAATRQIADEVDWVCEVKTLFRDSNLNCGIGPSSAITWFFEHEEEGIILEDDCLPSPSFFHFCQELLERYRDDLRIMHIGGNNFLNGWQKNNEYSYYFSISGHIWGWATWRRAWKTYDFKIRHYSTLKMKGYFDNFFVSPFERFYQLRKFDQITAGEIDTWDYQWDFARYINSGLAIVPSKNLVKNIGFGSTATHTKNHHDKYAKIEAHEIDFPLMHPNYVLRDFEADKKYFSILMKDRILSKLRLGG